MWNICRTCMSEEEKMISIFNQGKSPSINAMIMEIASIELLPNDTSSLQICVTCLKTLEITYNFKEQVIRCNEALQKQAPPSKLLTPHEVKKEKNGESEEDDNLCYEQNGYKSVKYSSPELLISTGNDTCDLSSETDITSLNIAVPLTNQALNDIAEGSSDVIKHVTHLEVYIKSEEVEVEDHGVQFEDNGETNQQQIMITEESDDDKLRSENDLPLTWHNGSSGSYSKSQNIQQNSSEDHNLCSHNEVDTNKMARISSNGLKRLREEDCPSSGKSFKCSHCNELFNEKSTFTSHVYKHSQGHKCEICEKTFPWTSHLKRHMKMHTDEKRYRCYICNAHFKWECALNRHIDMHTGTSKLHKCEVCGTTFSRASNLKIHMRKHTLEKPYKCLQCNARFMRTDRLNEHVRIHTGETTPKPHKCEICEKCFTKPSILKKHMSKHSSESL